MPQHRFIDDLLADYLTGQIGSASPVRAKRALQEICSLYARGLHLRPPSCATIEIATVGQLEANILDNKVRRWCLNVLGLIGTPKHSKEAIERVIERFHNDPDTIASALTAYFRVNPNAYSNLHDRSYLSPEQIVLAGHIGGFGIRLRNDTTTINVEREGPSTLRTALVAVGLNKAPENLFHPRYENSELVRQLSKHDDIDVAQYAVWAINEHPDLGVEHLGFDISEIGAFPSNMRSWTYRLFGEADISDALRHDVLMEGSIDASPEARLNLARGLRDTWYDGVEGITCQWYHDEQVDDVREEIVDHMIRQSERCSEYNRIATEAFMAVPPHSTQAQRMFASSRGSPLYTQLRKLAYEAEGDLFATGNEGRAAGGNTVTNNTFNIGNIQGGAVSLGGDAHQVGDITNKLTGDQALQVRTQLKAFAEELRKLPNQTDEVQSVAALIEDASENPEPSRLARVKKAIQSVFSGAESLAKFGENAAKLAGMATTLLAVLPH